MARRIFIIGGLLAAGIAGVYVAFVLSRPVPQGEPFAGSSTYHLLFGPGALLILIAASLGIFFRAISKRPRGEPTSGAGKILRHDERTFFSHWAHAFSVVMLAGSGTMMGPLFVPRFVHTPEEAGFALNVHFVGVVIFVFGLFYYISDVIIEGGLRELLPEGRDIKDAFSYYTAKLTGSEAPPQGKYLASEKLAYPVWVVLVGGITITGGMKVAAHVWSFSGAFMGAMSFMHDVCAFGIVILLAIHVILGAVVPWSWPLLRSMVTGYISEEYVRKYHGRWYKEIQKA